MSLVTVGPVGTGSPPREPLHTAGPWIIADCWPDSFTWGPLPVIGAVLDRDEGVSMGTVFEAVKNESACNL